MRRERKYEPGEEDKIELAISMLKEARDLLKGTNCPRTKSRVQAAISSALGARRNVGSRKFDFQRRKDGLR